MVTLFTIPNLKTIL